MDPCVRSILCALSAPILSAVKAAIQAQQAVLQAQLGILEALLLQAQIVNFPIHAAAALAEAARTAIQASISFIPFTLFADCVDLGVLSLGLKFGIDAQLVEIEQVLRDAERALSIEEEIKTSIDTINAIIQLYTDILTEMVTC